jgi:hypothetical protein
VKFPAHRLEQIAQVELLGPDLDIDVEVIPQAARQVLFVCAVEEMVDQALDFVGNVAVVDLLQADSLARSVLGADIKR